MWKNPTLRRLSGISLLFPEADEASSLFLDSLAEIVGDVGNSETGPGGIALYPANPRGALPVTSLELAEVDYPRILFETEEDIYLPVDRFLLVSTVSAGQASSRQRAPTGRQDVTMLQDRFGPYMRVQTGADPRFVLEMGELAKRLRGHVTGIDHLGVNLPTGKVSSAAWNGLIGSLAKSANVYRYPTGEDWPFIVPSTDSEFDGDISSFVAGRQPKFELVYDSWAADPLIQINLQTDLTRSQLEELLPEPYATAFPDLGDIFRTVYVYSPWDGLGMRIDLTYKGDGTPDDWATAKWLVTEGGRIV
ncbi:MAG: hypothetical protein ABI670_15835 [Chloroflexota bacterium]